MQMGLQLDQRKRRKPDNRQTGSHWIQPKAVTRLFSSKQFNNLTLFYNILLINNYYFIYSAVGCRGQRRSRHNELGNIPTFQHHAMEDIYKESSLSDLTVADLKSVIDTEFPVRNQHNLHANKQLSET